MIRIVKGIACAIGAMVLMMAVLWGGFVYVTKYKVTTVANSVAPEGTYELLLQAIGEADWPFGSASGRLILKEGKREIIQADFELYDDGARIREESWQVNWWEDHVEIILSGSEQADEQVLLYYSGEKKWKQLNE